MFRNLKLKNTLICEWSLLFPSLLSLLAGLLAVAFIKNEEIAGLALIGCLILAFLFIIPNFTRIFSIDFTLSSLHHWQRDRLSFFTEINGTSCIEIQNAISARISKWGKTSFVENGATLNYCKTKHTINGLDKIIHQHFMVFNSPVLTYDNYRKILGEANEYAKKFMDSKKDQAAAIAVIFLADHAEQAVLNKVREDYVMEEEYILLPLIYDNASRQYYFDALYEYNFVGKSAKNYLLDSIKKVVFGGKLPLENNDRFDYSNEISKWQDKTLGDLLDDIKEQIKKDKNFAKDTAEQLLDGQVLYHDEALYIKHNGSLACFITFTEEDTPNKVSIWSIDVWEYPKQTEISKKDLAVLKQIAIDYFKMQNKEVEFDSDIEE